MSGACFISLLYPLERRNCFFVRRRPYTWIRTHTLACHTQSDSLSISGACRGILRSVASDVSRTAKSIIYIH